MHPEQIKARIRMNGTTPSAIAAQLGVSRMTVSQVIHGRGTSARIASLIGKVTGEKLGTLWPGRYPAHEFAENLAAAMPKTAASMPSLKPARKKAVVA